jgi:hypothetical protein
MTPAALDLLFAIRRADEDHGGLLRHEMTDDEAALAEELAGMGFVERLAEYGESPDGEDDERDAGGAVGYRITGAGVEALRARE